MKILFIDRLRLQRKRHLAVFDQSISYEVNDVTKYNILVETPINYKGDNRKKQQPTKLLFQNFKYRFLLFSIFLRSIGFSTNEILIFEII